MFKGVALSVGASLLFAVLYSYSTLLEPLSGTQVFGWRMLLTFPCLAFFLRYVGGWADVRDLGARLRRSAGLVAGVAVTSGLLAAQIWLFMWAPLHGRSLQVSLGYFLLPLVMVVAGGFIYRERLTRGQTWAAAFAALGVAHELYRVGSFSWETLLVAFGYPVYFMLRRKLRTDNLAGLLFEMALMQPLVVWFVLAEGWPLPVFNAHREFYLLIPLLGVISASALAFYMLASRALPFGLFGLLGFVEPVLLLCVALLLGARIQPDEWLTYGPIWLAVALLVAQGALHLIAERRAG